MKKVLLFLSFLFLFFSSGFSQQQKAPNLAGAEEFAVLGGNVNNTGSTLVYAKVGATPGAVVGFPPGVALGGVNQNNLAAQNAQAGASAAYDFVLNQPSTSNLTGTQLGKGFAQTQESVNGQTLTRGVYKFNGNALLSGQLRLDGENSSDGVFIFQIDGDLIIDPGSVINVLNGAQPKNVFFQVAGNITIGTGGPAGQLGANSALKGNLLVQNNITLSAGSTLEGRALGISASSLVTLNDNTIFLPNVIETDLRITKTASAGPFNIGDNVTFTIVVRNFGPDDATNVRVTETLPSNLSFVSFSSSRAGITFDATTGVAVIGNLDFGQTVTLTLVAKITAAGPTINTVTVTSNEPEITPGNNTDTTPPLNVPVSSTDLSVIKTISPLKTIYNVGETITYTITARNNGPDNATNVVVNDKLPASLTLRSFTVTSGNYDPATGIYSINNLNTGSTAVLTITAVINSAGTITNTATISGGQTDQVPGNNTSSVTIVANAVPLADLGIVKSISAGPFNLGGEVIYTLTITNFGPDAATNVVVRDNLPASLQFIRFTSNPSTAVNLATSTPATGVFRIDNIANGATIKIFITAKIISTGSIINTATVGGDQVDPNPGGTTTGTTGGTTSGGTTSGTTSGGTTTGTTSGGTTSGGTTSGGTTSGGTTSGGTTDGTTTGGTTTGTTSGGTTTGSTSGTTSGGTTTGTTSGGTTTGSTSGTTSGSTTGTTSGGTTTGTTSGTTGGGTTGGNTDEETICVLPDKPIFASGPASVCSGNTVSYSVQAIPGVTSYTFTLPSDWNNNKPTIVVLAGTGNPSISVIAGTASGVVSVVATNACGNSEATSLAVTATTTPATPGPITANPSGSVCSATPITFSVAPMTGATTYNWMLPGGTILSGQGTNSITALVGPNNTTLSVTAANGACASAARTLNLVPAPTPAQPGVITDISDPCTGLTYTIEAQPGVMYNWTVTAGFEIVSGQKTNKVTIRASASDPNVSSGTVSVTAKVGDCESAASTFNIDVTRDDTQLSFPNAISPNGDGFNDTWKVKNILNFPDNELVIFNRWGNEVYRKKGYRNEWMASGLEQGSYFYVFRVRECNGNTNYKGSITVYR